MKLSTSPSALLSGSLLLSATPIASAQRRGLQPDALHLLIRGVDYTFEKMCDNYMNPDMYFDEVSMYRDIQAIANDLEIYMWGSSIDSGGGIEGIHTLPFTDPDRHLERTIPRRPLVDNTAAELYNYFQRFSKAAEIDCGKFEQDLRDFSESFQNMSYAISEKCYRQCQPQGYVAYAVENLQRTFEQHYKGGFYAQVREIEAQTGCRFDDRFMIENERAVDYTKVWISTFQSLETPCAGLGKRSVKEKKEEGA